MRFFQNTKITNNTKIKTAYVAHPCNSELTKFLYLNCQSAQKRRYRSQEEEHNPERNSPVRTRNRRRRQPEEDVNPWSARQLGQWGPSRQTQRRSVGPQAPLQRQEPADRSNNRGRHAPDSRGLPQKRRAANAPVRGGLGPHQHRLRLNSPDTGKSP